MVTYQNRPERASEGGLTRLLSLGDAFGKASACIAVMGYMSARWHWNALGISMIKPLSLSAYLAETLLFAVQTVWRLALVGTIIIVIMGTIALVLKILGVSPSSNLPPSMFNSAWAGCTVVALSSLLALVLIHLTTASGDLLVGPVDKNAARRFAEYRWFQNVVGSTYEMLWFILGALGFLVAKQRTMPRNGTGSFSFVWRIAWIPVLIGFITLPMLFGTFVRPILYPAAAVSWKLGEQKFFLCGVLVGNDAGSVILWEQSGDYGAVVKVPEKALTSLATGPLTRPLSIRADPAGPDAQMLKKNCISLQQKLAT